MEARFEQAKHIAAGITNYVRLAMNISDKEVEQVSAARMRVCNNCPNIDVSQNRCTICKCFLNLKTRSMDSFCPHGYWKAVTEHRR